MSKGKQIHIVITQFEAYQDGRLSPAELERFEEHLASCEECRAWFEETTQLVERLREERPHRIQMSPAAVIRIEAELERQYQKKYARNVWLGGLSSAVAWAVIILMIGLVVWQLPTFMSAISEETETPTEQNEQNEETGQEALDEQLIEAVLAGDSAEVGRQLDAGADPNAIEGDDFFFNPILRTAVMNEDIETVQLLLQNGADVNAPDSRGDELLWRAVVTGNMELARILIEAGANVNAINSQESTNLALAVDQGQVDMVELLLEAGADVEGRMIATVIQITGTANPHLHTALGIAAFRGELAIAQILLDAGADVRARAIDPTGNEPGLLYMPLHVAAISNQPDIATLLIDNGAEVDAVMGRGDEPNETPLLYAANMGSIETIYLLLEHGADPDVNWSDSWTNLSEETTEEVRQILAEASRANDE